MKTLVMIWVAVLVTLMSGFTYFNHVISGIEFVDVSKTLDVDSAFESGGLVFEPEKPVITAENASSNEMQVGAFTEEDDATPSLYLHPGASRQVTAHNTFLVATNNPQGSK